MATASDVTTTPVPLLDLARQNGPLEQEIRAAIDAVCSSGQFVLGPQVRQLEATVAEYCGVKHAIGCASGSDAILLALMAIDIGPGDEVILPSFTFFATASAVWRLGAKVVFADIDPETYNLDPTCVAKAVTPATKAIIPVHLFGQSADMAAFQSIVDEHSLTIIEDACQAIGAEHAGERVGAIGAMGCFSFYPTKNLGAMGDGGMLTTNDDGLADKLQLLRGHGMRPRYYHQVVGINSRLDSIQAAVINVKMPRLDTYCQLRAENAARYTQLLTDAGLADHLGLPVDAYAASDDAGRHVWNQYTIRVPGGRRDALRAYLGERGIGSEIYYPVPLHQQECFAELGYDGSQLPHTEQAAKEVLALPIFPELTAAEQQLVVAAVGEFFATCSAEQAA